MKTLLLALLLPIALSAQTTTNAGNYIIIAGRMTQLWYDGTRFRKLL